MFKYLAKHFDVISPNLIETQTILSISPADGTDDVVHAARTFHDTLSRQTTVIIRAGELGSYTVAPDWEGWVPAYWKRAEQDQVVDVTGGGNAWMGGLCAGMLLCEGDMRRGECSSWISSISDSSQPPFLHRQLLPLQYSSMACRDWSDRIRGNCGTVLKFGRGLKRWLLDALRRLDR